MFHRQFFDVGFFARLSVTAVFFLSACAESMPASVRAEMLATPKGTVTVVEFVDFECPFCRRMHMAAAPSLKKYEANVRIVRKQVPLAMHAQAEPAARAYLCGVELGARANDLADAFFTASPGDLAEEPAAQTAVNLDARADGMKECMHDTHIAARLHEDSTAFRDANGEGVPLTFVGSKRLDGAVDQETFEAALQSELEKAR